MAKKTLLLALIILCFIQAFSQQKGYYRSPAIYKNTVVFTAEGDLWKFDMESHQVSRLTTDQGLEESPVFSPDGNQIAFFGTYEGYPEIYTMSIMGGVPRRLTYETGGSDKSISGWTSEGKILYSTTSYNALPCPQLVLLDPMSLKHTNLPLFQASMGCYTPLGTLYFTRFPNQGSKTKRYQGGWIEQIWKFDGKHEAENLTGDFKGTSTRPMFYKDRIYFLSDRDGTMNIWSMNLDGKDLKQNSFSKGFDLQSPNIYESKIVYQKGADIYVYDIEKNEETLLDIHLISDFDQRKLKWIKSPKESISYADISPNGNYVAIVSRGRVFVSPAKADRWLELSRQSGIRVKDVHFLNDKTLAFLSDQNGEYEVFKRSADGSDLPVQITKNSKTIITDFRISPDGKYIAYNDKNYVLRIAETSTGEVKFKYESSFGGVSEISWSPNSQFLNITDNIENTNAQIHVLDTRNMKMNPISSSGLNSYGPTWTSNGKWIYYLSERNLVTKINSPWGPRQPEPYYTQVTGIYALPLDSSAKFPFLPSDTWLKDSIYSTSSPVKEDGKKHDKKSKNLNSEALNYHWDWSKTKRYTVPIKTGNIVKLAAIGDFLYWLDSGPDGEYNSGKVFALKISESKKYEPTEIAGSVSGFEIAPGGKKILVLFTDHNMAVADANGEKIDLEKSKVDLGSWAFSIDPQQDWKQMFYDSWRMMRDYFYDRDLHKVDWEKVKARYEPLLPRLTDRDELDDLMSQMVGELSALHTFVYGGEKRRSQDRIQLGFLGAELSKTNNGFLIRHIYKNDPDVNLISPLNQPELNIHEGDIITDIDNYSLKEVNDIGQMMSNKLRVPVKLKIQGKNQKVSEQIVKPFSSQEANLLRYNEWEYQEKLKVDSMGKGDIGYIHLKAMGSQDMDAFVRQYYPIFNRKGLILDMRTNFGGNIDSWVLEKLIRKAWMYWQGRAGGPTWNMPYAFRGHMVLLCNQQTASDGEAISEGFRRLNLGKVIGTRSWGGEIWLSSDNVLVDNGIASAAEMGVFGSEGKWLIEGHGVDPDIEVDNLPFETYLGKDAQLETALAYLKKEIADHPVEAPKVPNHPDKSFIYK